MNLLMNIFLFILVVSIILFFLRKRVVRILHFIVVSGFVISIVLLLISLFLPTVFDQIAQSQLEQVGLYESITEIDYQINTIVNLPQNAINSITDLFRNPDELENDNENTIAIIEDNLYPYLIKTISNTYRTATLIISAIMLILFVYLRYTIDNGYELIKREEENKKLKEDLDKCIEEINNIKSELIDIRGQ